MNEVSPEIIPFDSERVEWVLDQSYPITLEKLKTTLQEANLLKMTMLLMFKRRNSLKSYIDRVAGEIGLMILGTVPQGRLLGAFGGPELAQLFLIGNPLIALRMLLIHPQAGVYAPLRVMFSGDDLGRTIITYDRPSKIFGQWRETIFDETGKMLDGKMEALIRKLIA